MQVTIPDHLFAELPFYDVVETDETVVVELHNRADVADRRGALQTGLVATLIDVAGGRLAFAAGDRRVGVSTADMKVHYLEPIVEGPARAVATFVRKGRRSIVVAVDVFDVGADRLAVRATLTFAVLGPQDGTQPATAP